MANWIDDLQGDRLIDGDGAEILPRTAATKFVDSSATYNPATNQREVTTSGGGGSSGPDVQSSQLTVIGNLTEQVGAFWDWDPELSEGQTLMVGIYVHMTQVGDAETAGVLSCVVGLRMFDGNLEFAGGASVGAQGPPGTWDATHAYINHDASLAFSSGRLRVNLYAHEEVNALAVVRVFREPAPVTFSFA